jgi:hypothetical protein
VVEDNILHTATRVSLNETRYFSKEDRSILPMVHQNLARSMAEMIVEKIPMVETVRQILGCNYDTQYCTEYHITAAFLPESRYKELLQMEKDLRELRRLVRG